MTDTKFEVGDIVDWMGVEGVVKEILGFPNDGHVYVDFYQADMKQGFHPDGKLYGFHKEPSLKLIKKAKKKITVECWVNVYSNKRTDPYTIAFDTKSEAEMEMCRENYLTTVHFSKEIEI